MRQMPWFERRFSFDTPAGAFPGIVERLRGTPARLEERLGWAAAARRTARAESGWSIPEHVGHLGDLEELWLRRLDDLLAGAGELSAADLSNRRTSEAGHDRTPLPELLERFRTLRRELVARLAACRPEDVERTALHPRLRQPMRTIDHALFVAEHDDHHLAHIGMLLGTGSGTAEAGASVPTDRTRHLLAALDYRMQRVLAGAPGGFDRFAAGAGTRTPHEIVRHVAGVLDRAVATLSGEPPSERADQDGSWTDAIGGYQRVLRELDAVLAAGPSAPEGLDRITQGPIADALTHVGQLAMLRRLAGAPVTGESYLRADVRIGRFAPMVEPGHEAAGA